MVASKLPRISVRLERVFIDKLSVIAYRNIRPTTNDQVRAILIRYVLNYEKTYGEIDEAAIMALPDEWKRTAVTY